MTDAFMPTAAFSFTVSIGASPTDVDASFQEVSGIATEIDTESVAEGGENRFVHRLPQAVKHPRLVLKRGVAALDSPLVVWCRDVLDGGLARPITTKRLRLSLRDATGQPLRAWSFDGAFPVKWSLGPFESTSNELTFETIELSYAASTRAA